MKAGVRSGKTGVAYTSSQPKPPFTPQSNPNDVLIQVYASAVNPVDYMLPESLTGTIFGLDFAGVVQDVGENVTTLQKGDAVFGGTKGSLAEYCVTPADRVAKKGDKLNYLQAAALPVAYLTALQGLRIGNLANASSVLVIGASGGCGIAALHVCQAVGAKRVVAICSGKNADLVKEAGATEVVDYTQGMPLEVFFLKNLDKFDCVFDAATGIDKQESYTEKALKLLKANTGEYIQLNASPDVWKQHFKGTLPKHQHILQLQPVGEDLDTIRDLLEKSGLRPKITLMPFDEKGLQQGFDLLRSRHAAGKIVFKVSPAATEGLMMAAIRANNKGVSFTTMHPIPPFSPETNPFDVKIAIHAAAINPVDYKLPASMVGPVFGLDFSGIVVNVGTQVTDFLPGDAVYGGTKGSLAECCVTPSGRIAKKSDMLNFMEAASLPVAYLSAYQGLVIGNVGQGSSVLIIGASGGCGIAALHLAQAMGATRIVAICSGKNEALVKEAGATEVVDYTQGMPLEVFFLKNLDSFHCVYDAATGSGKGEEYTPKAKKLLLQGGVGQYIQLNANPDVWEQHRMGTLEKWQHVLQVKMVQSDLQAINKLLEKTKVRPHVTPMPFTAEGVKEGFELLRSRRARGKIVFTVSSSCPCAPGKMRAGIREGAASGVSFTYVQPQPTFSASQNPHDVRIKVKAAAINPVDYKLPKKMVGPVFGMDFAGVVQEVGANVTEFKAGDEVFGGTKGSLADFCVSPADRIAKKGHWLSFAEAASLPIAYLSGLQGFRIGKVKEGCSVLIIGASGGCGIAALHLAQAMGVTRIAAICSGKNEQLVKEAGATEVIDYTQNLPLEKFFLKNQESFDCVYDAATGSGKGEDYTDKALKLLKKSTGECVQLNASAEVWEKHMAGKLHKHQHLLQVQMVKADLEQVVSLLEKSGLKPHTSPMPFDQVGVKEGFDLLKSRRARGKIVFNIST